MLHDDPLRRDGAHDGAHWRRRRGGDDERSGGRCVIVSQYDDGELIVRDGIDDGARGGRRWRLEEEISLRGIDGDEFRVVDDDSLVLHGSHPSGRSRFRGDLVGKK